MNRYQNKICLITASSTGIGLAIAHRFASEGATVIISFLLKFHLHLKYGYSFQQDRIPIF